MPIVTSAVEQLNNDRQDVSGWLYQAFHFRPDGAMYAIGGTIPLKLETFGNLFPADLRGKRVMDLGCQLGYWCFESANRGASSVLGLDSGMERPGQYRPYIELDQRVAAMWPRYNACRFEEFNFGPPESLESRFEPVDLLFCCDVYHHAYALTPDHDRLFAWLSRHVRDGGVMLWQNPSGVDDVVAREHVIPSELHAGYSESAIVTSAKRHFRSVEAHGRSLHWRTRQLFLMSK